MDEPLNSGEPQKPEHPLDDDSSSESLSKVPPTPMIEPVIPKSWTVPLIIAGGAGALALIALLPAPCAGATRSAKLKWQERQREIAQAQIAERDANRHGSQRP
ncbi:MAG TPA: hypothetical protein VEI07_24710 [Planctomycetaceae bacterium]|nr:hypothetical protein [Planctomycetaceae bacterium]